MKTKVTIQDIADALHLSRITVSKALNNSPNVSAKTRELVFQKAREMNYKSVNYIIDSGHKPADMNVKNFAFVMGTKPTSLHIGSEIMAQLEQEIRREGYSLTLHIIAESDISSMTLPANLNRNQAEAIICLEMFHPEYSRLICSTGKPVLFIDACADFYSLNLNCDLLLMESRSSVYQMILSLYQKYHLTSAGFVGDINHCLSFRERYEGFLLASNACKLTTQTYNIIGNDYQYGEPGWVLEQLHQMKGLPNLFFCANDGIAQILIQNLKELNYRIPEDILVCGFDGLPSMNPVLNSLTTIRTPCKELGVYASRLLFQRLQNSEKITSSTYLSTEICFKNTAP